MIERPKFNADSLTDRILGLLGGTDRFHLHLKKLAVDIQTAEDGKKTMLADQLTDIILISIDCVDFLGYNNQNFKNLLKEKINVNLLDNGLGKSNKYE